jgi:hypothetical protein
MKKQWEMFRKSPWVAMWRMKWRVYLEEGNVQKETVNVIREVVFSFTLL